MGFDGERDYTDAAEILKVLGHPMRLSFVTGLCAGECNVKQIWECLGIPQPTASQHLALLKYKGVIASERVGTEVRYSVVHPLARKLVEIMSEGSASSSEGI